MGFFSGITTLFSSRKKRTSPPSPVDLFKVALSELLRADVQIAPADALYLADAYRFIYVKFTLMAVIKESDTLLQTALTAYTAERFKEINVTTLPVKAIGEPEMSRLVVDAELHSITLDERRRFFVFLNKNIYTATPESLAFEPRDWALSYLFLPKRVKRGLRVAAFDQNAPEWNRRSLREGLRVTIKNAWEETAFSYEVNVACEEGDKLFWRDVLRVLWEDQRLFMKERYRSTSTALSFTPESDNAEEVGLKIQGKIRFGAERSADMEIFLSKANFGELITLLIGLEKGKELSAKGLSPLLAMLNGRVLHDLAPLLDRMFIMGPRRALEDRLKPLLKSENPTFADIYPLLERADKQALIDRFLIPKIGVSGVKALFYGQSTVNKRMPKARPLLDFNEQDFLVFLSPVAQENWAAAPGASDAGRWQETNFALLGEWARHALKREPISARARRLLEHEILEPLEREERARFETSWALSAMADFQSTHENLKRLYVDRLSNSVWAEILAPHPSKITLLRDYLSASRYRQLKEEIAFVASVRGIEWKKSIENLDRVAGIRLSSPP